MEALQVGTLAPRSPHTQKEDAPKTDFKEAHEAAWRTLPSLTYTPPHTLRCRMPAAPL